jgi:hypothetical protein
MKAIIKADFPEAYEAVLDFPKQVEIVIDVAILDSLYPVPKDTIRVFVTNQPEGAYNEIIRKNANFYTHLLTADLLDLPNSHLFVGCGSWLKPAEIPKKLAVSTILSGRNCLPGHKLRFELYHRRKEIIKPFDFYLGTHNMLPEFYYTPDCIILSPNKEAKVQAMNCKYHIAIDSYKRLNHYSEKLIDCFLTKTIPIYWGCTNIGDYFNADGIIQVDNVTEIINYVNAFCVDDFPYMEAVEENYQLALKQYNFGEMLKNAIEKII